MKRRFVGKIVSNKMDKTVVVAVESVKEHPIYKKKYKVTARFKAHVDNSKDFNVGDVVTLEETRPMSKEKRWAVVEDSKKGAKE